MRFQIYNYLQKRRSKKIRRSMKQEEDELCKEHDPPYQSNVDKLSE